MALGGALKIVQTFLYALCFCCAAIILGIYSYFLSVLSDRNLNIPQWEKGVEGIAGIGVVYTIFAVILTCCLGGKTIFALLAIVMDILLCAGFIAIAVLTRHGVGSCSGNVNSPLGSGPSNSRSGYGSNGFGTGSGENVTYASSLGFACRLNKVCFAVAVIGAFLFLFSAITQVCLGRHHRKEKKFGPGPSNNYTSGSGGGKWYQRKRGPKTTKTAYAKDAEATGGLAATGNGAAYRPSHETGYTGTTAGHNEGTYTGNKYESTGPNIPTTGTAYHTGPTGTAVNPYGQQTAGTNF